MMIQTLLNVEDLMILIYFWFWISSQSKKPPRIMLKKNINFPIFRNTFRQNFFNRFFGKKNSRQGMKKTLKTFWFKVIFGGYIKHNVETKRPPIFSNFSLTVAIALSIDCCCLNLFKFWSSLLLILYIRRHDCVTVWLM